MRMRSSRAGGSLAADGLPGSARFRLRPEAQRGTEGKGRGAPPHWVRKHARAASVLARCYWRDVLWTYRVGGACDWPISRGRRHTRRSGGRRRRGRLELPRVRAHGFTDHQPGFAPSGPTGGVFGKFWRVGACFIVSPHSLFLSIQLAGYGSAARCWAWLRCPR